MPVGAFSDRILVDIGVVKEYINHVFVSPRDSCLIRSYITVMVMIIDMLEVAIDNFKKYYTQSWFCR